MLRDSVGLFGFEKRFLAACLVGTVNLSRETENAVLPGYAGLAVLCVCLLGALGLTPVTESLQNQTDPRGVENAVLRNSAGLFDLEKCSLPR